MKLFSYIRHAVPHDAPARFFFQTLGNPVRWAIVQLLWRRGPQPVHAIIQAVGVEQSRVSHNLRRLERCGFIRVAPNGRERIYALDRESVAPLLRLVERHIRCFCSRVCCGGKREVRAKPRPSPRNAV